ncbi:NUDIX domain-containing protein [Aliikangiella coralliicola]|uniref:NUDIX domain-containing protein n=1 Tax=Aliikangiella coralliicola TaxID=2592383 RepID=A0A545UA64_9GAMM|nr:NUDIX domain-containing protein [Aliikangiella coralliicola]TQV86364.1 NUDIX domain-containing protein [Aliikangiella coralliicola]
MQHLNSTDNRYGGTYVSPEDLPEKKSDFAGLLFESIKIWKNHNILVVWIKIPSSRADLLPILYNLEFENHHSGNDFIMLTKKLQEEAIVPPYAKHTIGVGGLVINSENELLTIREKAHVKKYPHNWKFPGGMLDPFEHIETAAMREVFEETGVKTEFESFIGFRHHHQGQFSTSNIYAVCRLRPLTCEITIQESEIADARWFPIEEYLSDEKIGKYNKQVLTSALNCSGLESIKLPGYMSSDEDYEVFLSR